MFIENAVASHVPTVLNLGSGKDFRPDALNVGSDGSWAPDAVLDLGATDLGPDGIALTTERFGAVRLRPGQFRRIFATDVLEHVPDLKRLMTACLELLGTDGCLEASVPYDLSLGAWQDPAHLRGFNERSWLYFSDWFWTQGWTGSRFAVEALTFVPSPYGEELRDRGLARDEIVRTPRAIDAMSVILRKVTVSDADRAAEAAWRGRRTGGSQRNRREGSPRPAAPATGATQPIQPWDGAKDRYCTYIVTPKGYTHHQAFDDVALALSDAFVELGGSAPVVSHPSQWNGRTPLVLAPHLLTPNMSLILPPGTLLFNMEQVDRSSTWMNETYMALLRRHAVLDYSHRNAEALRRVGVERVSVLPIGFAPALARIARAPAQDVDVLFYGCVNARRAKVLDDLKARGLNVLHLFDCYGADRDAMIARSKIVLNLHFYESAIFESARVTLLLANKACVVTEGDLDDPDLADLADGMAVCRYDELADRCAALLADPDGRAALAERGHERIRGRRQADLLARLFGADRSA